MLPSTSSSSYIANNLQYPRRLLVRFYQPQQITTTPAPTPNDQQYPSSSSSVGFDANLVMILSVLLCAIICSLCVNSLIKCVLKCSRFVNREPNYYINATNQGVNRKGGVDKRVLRTFPVVKYAKEMMNLQNLDRECVICLSEFKKGDKLRVLPKCHHGLHVKCIDKWLKSHLSCPTCRQSLVDTCQKIVGCDNHQANSSSSLEVTRDMNVIAVNIVPLQREDLVRDYRG